MRSNGVSLDPTLASNEIFLEVVSQDVNLTDQAANAPQAGVACVPMARDAKVQIATGTDFSQQGALARECVSLDEVELPPMEVLRASTKAGAEILGMEDHIGTIEVGKVADFVA
jgi:imidazolonepropionase-like amidohydrolase